ncbi:MAG: NTP transferase domain-containing protein [Methylococcales bacterium]|nr:NTP transferase domain-containing protein [Methylococcales bacterium]
MNASITNVYAILLAAGASSRMGSPKQILEWRNRSLLEHAILNAKSVLHERVIVVLGAHAEAIQTAVDFEGITSITNSDWQDGIR